MGTASTQEEKVGESIWIRILGRENAWSNRTTRRRDGVQVIEVKTGEQVTWENTQDQVCTITFIRGGCAFGHDHEKCHFTIEPKGTRSEDVVRAKVGREFEFSAQFGSSTPGDISGTPKIIVSG
jgi:hypothetical protein